MTHHNWTLLFCDLRIQESLKWSLSDMYVLEISFLHSNLHLELWVKGTCKLNLLLQNFYLPQTRTKYNV